MKRLNSTNPFELENLEPRVLLSGDPIIGAVHTAIPDDLLIFDISLETIPLVDTINPGKGDQQNITYQESLQYDYSQNQTDIFAGLTEESSLAAQDDAASDEIEALADKDQTLTVIETSSAIQQISPFSSSNEGNIMITASQEGDDSNSATAQLTESLISANGPPQLPGLRLVDPDISSWNGQIFWLNFEGAQDVTYNGPVTVEHIDIPAFRARDGLKAQETLIASKTVTTLNDLFAESGVSFTSEAPSGFQYSTIYVGGNSTPFASYGNFIGISEKVDTGNTNPQDNAFVFSTALTAPDLETYVCDLSALIGHEAGHLLGYAHDHSSDVAGPLAEVAADADKTFSYPTEKGSGDNVHNITLGIGTYTFEVDADPNRYLQVDWYTTNSGGSPQETAYLYYYDDKDFTFSTAGSYWVRAEVYKSDFFNKTYEWLGVYRWNVTVPASPALAVSTTSLDFGSSSTSKTFTVRNSGGGTLNYSTSDNQSWLSVSPTSGSSTGEYDTITATVNRSGLRFGSYSGTITVDPDTGSNKTVSVSMTVPDATPTVSRKSPTNSSLTVSYNTNQSFTATGQDTGGNLDYADWYLTGPENDHGTDYWFGDTDFTRDSSYSHLFDVAGDYTLKAEFSDSKGNKGSITWNVTVPSPPALAVSTTSLAFGSSSTSKTFTVRNSGGGTLSYSISDNQGWLSASPASGNSTGEYDTITATVSRSGLRFGDYSGTITVDPDTGSNQTVSVSMTVPDVTPTVSRKTPTNSSLTVSYNTTLSFTATGQDEGGNLDFADWYLSGPENDHGTDYWIGDSDFTRDSNYSHLFDVAGDYTLKAEFTDSNNNKGNTTWFIHVNPPPQPDLAISDIAMSDTTVYSGQGVNLDFWGNNITSETTSVTNVQMKAYWGTTQNSKSNLIGTEYFGEINGLDYNENEKTTIFGWTVPTLAPGTYWITAEIDSDNKQGNATGENDANNLCSESFTVRQVDLVISDIAMSDTTVYSGQGVNLDFWGNNITSETTSVTNVQMKAYWGTTQNSKSNLIGTEYFGEINGLDYNENEKTTIFGWTVPTLAPGTYWITAEIDSDNKQGNATGENDVNNLCSESFTVRVQPQITSVRWEDATGNELADGATRNTNSIVFIEVDTQGLRGSIATIYLYEDDGLLNPDEFITQIDITILPTSDTGRIQWMVPWTYDGSYLTDPFLDPAPEYRLWNTTSALKNITGVKSRLLKVTQPNVLWEDVDGNAMIGSVPEGTTLYLGVENIDFSPDTTLHATIWEDDITSFNDEIKHDVPISYVDGSEWRGSWISYWTDDNFLDGLIGTGWNPDDPEYFFKLDFFDQRSENIDVTLTKEAVIKIHDHDPAQGIGIPMVLIHGNSADLSSPDSLYGWDTFAQQVNAAPASYADFDIYVWKHPTELPIGFNGAAESQAAMLAYFVYESPTGLRLGKPGSTYENSQVLFVAHSQGGLVARSFMNTYNSTLATPHMQGDDVLGLITLATPHHGSPEALPDWLAGIWTDYYGNDAEQLRYFKTLVGPGGFGFDWNRRGSLNLAWDSEDGAVTITTDATFYNVFGDPNTYQLTPSDTNKSWSVSDSTPFYYQELKDTWGTLDQLNAEEAYAYKLITYGAYDSDLSDNAGAWDVLISLDESGVDDHMGLSWLTDLMGMMYSQQTFGGNYTTYYANDGLVPLQSALFLDLTYDGVQYATLDSDMVTINSAAVTADIRPGVRTRIWSGGTDGIGDHSSVLDTTNQNYWATLANDINSFVNQPPLVPDQGFTLPENSSDGTFVGTVTASDPDNGQTLTFAITGGNTSNAFSIDIAGQIRVINSAALNFEKVPTFTLTIQATDNGLPQLSNFGTVTINLSNVNEKPTDIALTSTSVQENQPSGTVVGTISSMDPDAGNSFTYTLAGGDVGYFTISGDTLKTSASFDYETKNSYSVRVRSTDQGGLWTEKDFAISVNNINEQPVIVNQGFSIPENSAISMVVGTVLASDPDAGQSLTYTITDGNVGNAFNINPATGQIAVATVEALNYEATQSFNLMVQVTDNGNPILTNSATVTVNLTDMNEAPTVGNPNEATKQDTVLTFGAADFAAAFSDPDAGDSLQKVKITALPINGTLKLGGVDVVANQEIDASQLDSLSYTPTPRYTGSDSFSWNGSDGSVYALNGASVNITVYVAPLPGDFDADGDVDGTDAFKFVKNYGRLGFVEPMDGDFDQDGDVDDSDLQVFSSNFGRIGWSSLNKVTALRAPLSSMNIQEPAAGEDISKLSVVESSKSEDEMPVNSELQMINVMSLQNSTLVTPLLYSLRNSYFKDGDALSFENRRDSISDWSADMSILRLDILSSMNRNPLDYIMANEMGIETNFGQCSYVKRSFSYFQLNKIGIQTYSRLSNILNS